ncbi:MAG: hypothetical protein HUN05_08945 [Desulfobacter sp.]|nr:MAG: hypothetical protein HUN05_08945 [Desulfobacter sp.]
MSENAFQDYYPAVPGFVYGGLLASLIDCHGTGTAAGATYRQQGRPMDSEPALRFVTASIHVDYLAPTPLGVELEIRGKTEEISPKKVVVSVKVHAKGRLCVKGRVVAAPMPGSMLNLIKGENKNE